MRKYTFVRVANNTTNGVALGVDNQDINVYKIIVGNPVSAGIVRLYDIQNPVNAATTNLAAFINFPTFSTTNINNGPYVFDFGDSGIRLGEGGNVMVTEDMQVTVVWSEN